jgi:hypothetical protein
MADYKTLLHEDITELHTKVKTAYDSAKKSESVCALTDVNYRPNGLRLSIIEKMTESYFEQTGEVPDVTALQRLSDLCLYEELTDTNEHKIAHNEYPIMSETQIARRQEGKHSRNDNNPKIEVPLGIAENYGTDGRVHDYPTRRQRSERENTFVDLEARERNKERNLAYAEFTKTQPVVTWRINS